METYKEHFCLLKKIIIFIVIMEIYNPNNYTKCILKFELLVAKNER